MATSTSTLLEVCNRVLLNANERTLTATTPLIGQQVKECVRQALHAISRNEWLWNQGKVNASSWTLSVATLPTNTQRVKAVMWDNDNGQLIPLKYMHRWDFDQYELDDYADNTVRALYYTLVDQNIVHVNPYPTTSAERNKIWFHTSLTITLPATDATTFAMPEDFTDLVVLYATSLYVKRHAEDLQLSRSFEEEYLIQLNQVRARQTITPQHAHNLYRGSKLSSYKQAL